MKHLLPSVLLLSFVMFGCQSDDDCSSNCDRTIEVSETAFNNASSTHINILSKSIDGDCLTIKFGASGCSDPTTSANLIDSEEIIYTNPAKRTIKLSVIPTGLCDAYFQNEISFDLAPLQINNNSSYQLLLLNDSSTINYNY